MILKIKDNNWITQTDDLLIATILYLLVSFQYNKLFYQKFNLFQNNYVIQKYKINNNNNIKNENLIKIEYISK